MLRCTIHIHTWYMNKNWFIIHSHYNLYTMAGDNGFDENLYGKPENKHENSAT